MTMTINRTSSSLVRYLGSNVKTTVSRGKLVNTVVRGQGNEQTRNAAVQRTDSNLVPASVDIGDYQAAFAYLERRGVSPVAAQTMAVVFIDAAKANNQSVMSLLESASDEALAITNANTYTFINQLRNLTTQLSG